MATEHAAQRRGPGLRELRAMSDDELVARHDALLADPNPADEGHVLAPDAYRDVLRLRAMEDQARALARLAGAIYATGAVVLALLVAILVLVA
jgi:hypothetical protein